jgi:RHS repeat-associated protein
LTLFYNARINATKGANHPVYNAFGELKSQTNAAVDCLFGYTGRAFDQAAQLQNNGHRWYEAVTGRWLSEDPKGLSGGDVSVNRYCNNSPVNYGDPRGLDMITTTRGPNPDYPPGGPGGGGRGRPGGGGPGVPGAPGGPGAGPDGFPGGPGGGPGGGGGGEIGITVKYDPEDIDGKGPAEGDACTVSWWSLFWSDTGYYERNPSKMDRGLAKGYGISLGMAAVAGGVVGVYAVGLGTLIIIVDTPAAVSIPVATIGGAIGSAFIPGPSLPPGMNPSTDILNLITQILVDLNLL